MPQGSQKAVSATAPPSYAQPYIVGNDKKGITGLLPAAQDWFNSSNPQYFPGSTVAGQSPTQKYAQDLTLSTANANLGNTALSDAAGGQLGKTLNGDYLNPGNPYLGAVSDAIWGQVAPRVQGAAELAGR